MALAKAVRIIAIIIATDDEKLSTRSLNGHDRKVR